MTFLERGQEKRKKMMKKKRKNEKKLWNTIRSMKRNQE